MYAMGIISCVFFQVVNPLTSSTPITRTNSPLLNLTPPPPPLLFHHHRRRRSTNHPIPSRTIISRPNILCRPITNTFRSHVMLTQSPLANDVIATAVSGGVALSLLRLWEETAKRHLFDQKLNRKLVHVSVGLACMLCWPMFSPGWQGALLAGLIPGINIVKMLLIGLGIYKDENTVKSMSRFGDHRELLKGPLYYAAAITLACVFYWRTSPIGFAAVCNLCAGDGLADIVGRRFGKQKLFYNKNKSVAGSIAMASAGFLTSIGFMHYFSLFGYVQESWGMAFGFLVVSITTALVESHPLSTELDDNITVPLASFVVGSLVL